jgi:hypothetical protein
MVWLNGNYNLDLNPFFYKAGTADIPVDAIVGFTTVQATADYPYARGPHQVIQSNKDLKTWLWGGEVLGTDSHTFPGVPVIETNSTDTEMILSAGSYDQGSVEPIGSPNQIAYSLDKVVWVWVTDRDGLQKGVLGAKVTWSLSPSDAGVKINDVTGPGISQYNAITKAINLQDGLLENLDQFGHQIGGVTDDPVRMHATGYLRAPTPAEQALFMKFWGTGGTSTITGLDPKNFAVAAIDLLADSSSSRVQVNIDITSHDFDLVAGQLVPGTVQYKTNVDFGRKDYLDDGITVGDANCDGVVNMGDVTAVERMILGKSAVTSNAIVNNEGTVDMGTVVKIERKILGLP